MLEFNKNIKNKIYSIVSNIPIGKIMTYGQIAKILKIRDARIIGWMLHQNDNPLIPCYRIIKSDGTCAKGYAFGGKEEQQRLLENDGIKFVNNKILDLKR